MLGNNNTKSGKYFEYLINPGLTPKLKDLQKSFFRHQSVHANKN